MKDNETHGKKEVFRFMARPAHPLKVRVQSVTQHLTTFTQIKKTCQSEQHLEDHGLKQEASCAMRNNVHFGGSDWYVYREAETKITNMISDLIWCLEPVVTDLRCPGQ